MRHSLKEMLATWSANIGHTHEAAVEAVYNLGHSAAAERIKQLEQRLKEATSPAPIYGEDGKPVGKPAVVTPVPPS